MKRRKILWTKSSREATSTIKRSRSRFFFSISVISPFCFLVLYSHFWGYFITHNLFGYPSTISVVSQKPISFPAIPDSNNSLHVSENVRLDDEVDIGKTKNVENSILGLDGGEGNPNRIPGLEHEVESENDKTQVSDDEENMGRTKNVEDGGPGNPHRIPGLGNEVESRNDNLQVSNEEDMGRTKSVDNVFEDGGQGNPNRIPGFGNEVESVKDKTQVSEEENMGKTNDVENIMKGQDGGEGNPNRIPGLENKEESENDKMQVSCEDNIDGTKSAQDSIRSLVFEDGGKENPRRIPGLGNVGSKSKESQFSDEEKIGTTKNDDNSINSLTFEDGGEGRPRQIPGLDNGADPVNPASLENNTDSAGVENGEESVHHSDDHIEVEKIAEEVGKQPEKMNVEKEESGEDKDPCAGRYVFVYRIPRKFNDDLVRDCKSLSNWTDMCLFSSNMGLGPKLENTGKVFSTTSWYATNQFVLEIIFRNRMKQYDCLTEDSSKASAFFVPFYAGLDVARYLWGYSASMRDFASLEMVKWLRRRPEWNYLGGRDHFMVAGRIAWDFGRVTDDDSSWGNKLIFLPEARNMTMLVLESSPWTGHDFAIPYPTYFHPSSDREVFEWQDKMRSMKRRTLFSFAGAPRPNLQDSIRNEIINQCLASRRRCRLLECNQRNNKCYKPAYVMKLFQNSVFCLQPPGDSLTRRSAIDSIVAGCIPVFFHPGSAYVQYIWHLPKNYSLYSVLILGDDVKYGKVRIEEILRKIPLEQVWAMREEVIKLIPKVIYADPRSKLEAVEDAFDLTVKGVIERVNKLREDMRSGSKTSFDVDEKVSWKYNLFGTTGAHEWDPFFSEQNKQVLDW
ncbi:Exostosin, GT47 domain [Dillenia turbinata]|uniref:Exostosin, GT47 domain n=1 Tax=Dillenia turbinata TaxID=194707 RepID=A0AAN8VLD4_9MAGN